MADGLVAVQAKASVDIARGADDAFCEVGVQEGSEDFAVAGQIEGSSSGAKARFIPLDLCTG
jgi:hypothetical protein